MPRHVQTRRLADVPSLRLPLEGSLNLTYRCNNHCRHCWLHRFPDDASTSEELTFDEIARIAGEARRMGCRTWSLSGGEPMLRPDFADIFELLTARAPGYSLNTNGTLITPEIARLLTRRGSKMVALYGATADVHDHVTRHPGSFDATMQGFAYLREAGAGFTVQIVPMRDNHHQLAEMIRLAESLSPSWRIGAAWLYLSACADSATNCEIARQRLSPAEVIELDRPDVAWEEQHAADARPCHLAEQGDRLFATCIAGRNSLHVDPYGAVTWCSFIKDPALRYDLRQGTFAEAWEQFIPSLADRVRGGEEYLHNCGACDLRADCRWCGVYGYLEHGRYSAKVEYLCEVARENRRCKENWRDRHRRHYQVAGITLRVEADEPITDTTFHPKFRAFEVEGPGDDLVTIRHHFSLPRLESRDLGDEVYRRAPWAIYRRADAWIYRGIQPDGSDGRPHQVAVFSADHTRARIYNRGPEDFAEGGLASLTHMPTDQILLAQLLADRDGCFLHAAGVALDGKGFLFVGHSDAGKSTTSLLLRERGTILCDDRIIVRRYRDGFRACGTWSHGDVPDVSPAIVPLRALLFLEQAPENRLVPLVDRHEVMARLTACVIRPLVTADWWEKTMDVLEALSHEVPCYVLRFDRGGGMIPLLEAL